MMLRLKRILIGTGLPMVALLVCQMGTACAPAPPTADPNDPAETLTALIQTLTAEGQTLPSATLPSLTGSTPTLPTTAPATSIPTDTPTITVTPSPVVPLVSVSKATNCRTGPGEFYAIVHVVEPGIKFEVVGKYVSLTTWIIKLSGIGECWLWGGYATVEGNVHNLPEYNPPVGSIQGVVSDLKTEDPIGDATVTIRPAIFQGALPENFKKRTDNEGFFIFPNVPMGEISITFEHFSHFSDKTTVIVRTGQPSKVNIKLKSTYLDNKRTPTPFPCPPLQPNCQPAPTQGPVAP